MASQQAWMNNLYTNTGSSSFTDFLRGYAPEMLPGGREALPAPVGDQIPHATTIVAVTCAGGVVMAGDRRATSGNMISNRDMEKVFRTDEYSCMGIAGTASTGIEMARLYQVELEHYEKLEGRSLSTDGKANRLATFVRQNLGAAMQGLVVVPIFAAYDEQHRRRPHLRLRRRRRPLRAPALPLDRVPVRSSPAAR